MNLLINQGRLRSVCKTFVFVSAFGLLQLQSHDAAAQWSSRSFKKGDALRLIVWQPWRVSDGKNQTLDLNGEYPINSRGNVFLPLVGDVKVVGHNPKTLSEHLKEEFSPYLQDPVIIVEPLIRVTMLGAFKRPGTYLIEPDASFWQLVDEAGGPKENSNLEKMWIERGGEVIKKDMLSGFERAYSLREMGIYSGDQVFIPERKQFRIRDALEILRFGVTLINIYFLIDRIGKN